MELNDTQLAQRLVGTWVTHPADSDIISTATYHPDGTGTEIVHRRNQPEIPDITVEMLWSIEEGILSLRTVDSTDERIPAGFELKDRIVSITEDRFVSNAYQGYGWGDGEQIVRVRQA